MEVVLVVGGVVEVVLVVRGTVVLVLLAVVVDGGVLTEDVVGGRLELEVVELEEGERAT